MSLRLALIGFGEVGQRFGRELVRRGAEVTATDILLADPRRAEALRRSAREAGVTLVESTGEACRGAEFVLSAVTADQAVAAAEAAREGLAPDQVYVDLNSVSPSTKRRVAQAVAPSGAGFVEFAVMAPVGGPGLGVPILAGGARAGEVAARLNPLGMAITPVSPEIGVASATKLCRSIVIKGLEALMVDLGLATQAAGVRAAVLASLKASYPGLDWDNLVSEMPGRVSRHGVRRAAEMREAAQMLEELGLDGRFSLAIAERQESFARAEAAAPRAAAE